MAGYYPKGEYWLHWGLHYKGLGCRFIVETFFLSHGFDIYITKALGG